MLGTSAGASHKDERASQSQFGVADRTTADARLIRAGAHFATFVNATLTNVGVGLQPTAAAAAIRSKLATGVQSGDVGIDLRAFRRLVLRVDRQHPFHSLLVVRPSVRRPCNDDRTRDDELLLISPRASANRNPTLLLSAIVLI